MDIVQAETAFCADAEHLKGLSPDTVRRYRQVIQQFVTDIRMNEVEQVSPDVVRVFFFRGRVEKRWAVRTYHTYLRTLSVFFKWCIRQGYVKQNPIVGLERPRLSRTAPPKLTSQAALRLLDTAYNYPYSDPFLRTRNHAIVAVFIYTGLRKKELLHLRFMDVDFANASLFVHLGKGAKDRIVPMGRNLATILSKYVEERKKLGRTCPECFTSFTHNMGLCESALRRIITQLRAASGINFTAHRLRHTFATLMLEGGCDIYSLSRMMGHDEISTTAIYLAASVGHLRSQVLKHPLET
jgi:site-specific recombinase XerD